MRFSCLAIAFIDEAIKGQAEMSGLPTVPQ